jgi:hypothetical protein
MPNCGNEFKKGINISVLRKAKLVKLAESSIISQKFVEVGKIFRKMVRTKVYIAQQQTQSSSNSSDDECTFAVSSSKITNIQI